MSEKTRYSDAELEEFPPFFAHPIISDVVNTAHNNIDKIFFFIFISFLRHKNVFLVYSKLSF